MLMESRKLNSFGTSEIQYSVRQGESLDTNRVDESSLLSTQTQSLRLLTYVWVSKFSITQYSS
jgi:hypothetical protein